jgi:hypothetical protein
MWKPVEQWSHPISLAIYHHSQVLIQAYSLEPQGSGVETYVHVGFGRIARLLPVHMANKPCRALGGDAVHRQVSWLVLARKDAVSQPRLPLSGPGQR